ncbi:hypothetical protein FOYG_02872 [Fusarium oxysporum NRRL 32931]|uniref:Uncharacterized protein n=1 Tax=Fusarium oxysporum NRRL 32931 TaxID=660029 RepID=W9J0M4_FUSOX|nr:hypothetical protein FOYG_02872 [Fusarium oxysporum NRRL 32931]EWY98327.1 hypothetical protein FOYG_02872 [Fusarium oxysporum NRRL 32931]
MFVTGSEGLITWYYLRGAHFRRLLRRPYLFVYFLSLSVTFSLSYQNENLRLLESPTQLPLHFSQPCINRLQPWVLFLPSSLSSSRFSSLPSASGPLQDVEWICSSTSA